MYQCTKCLKHGFHFERQYRPEDFLEGKPSSLIWVVGLNPKTEEGNSDSRTKAELESYFVPGQEFYSYFRDFKSVSRVVFEGFGQEKGTAHTDIVKCGSQRFPTGKVGDELVKCCGEYLRNQINTHTPRLVVCNGSPVSRYVKSILPPNEDPTNTETSYWTKVNDVDVCIVLSGFIGRIDNFARRRLGVEIEERLEESLSRRADDNLQSLTDVA